MIDRPLLRYFGGKWRIAPWIIQHMPPHSIYTESFAGAASVLLRKERVDFEVINDIDEELVNLYRVMRDPLLAEKLQAAIDLTPYARKEFELAYEQTGEPVERARRALFRAHAGLGSRAFQFHPTSFDSNTIGGGDPKFSARIWDNFKLALPELMERIRGVIVDCLPATEILQRYDNKDALHYIDPPYVYQERSDRRTVYAQEMSVDDHRELARVANSLTGYVIVSGYPSELYTELYDGWYRVEREARALKRNVIEAIWLSPRTWSALNDRFAGLPLFEDLSAD